MSGGGTGGHVYPALSVYRAMKEQAQQRGESLEVLYVGHANGVEAELVARTGLPFVPIQSGQIRGQAPWKVAMNGLRVGQGILQARGIMKAFAPDVVFITGGWVTAPVALAARWARVPVLIYLPDVTPGLAIRRLQRLAARVAVTVPEAADYFPGKAVVTGYPVREDVLRAERARARGRWQVPAREPLVLVFGGSRGARSINRALTAGVSELLQEAQVLHITGHLDYDWVQEARRALPQSLQARYHVYRYLHEEMPDALAAADVVVSRAGASVLGEFPARGLPAVLVPYPHAGRHQEHNARYLAERGAAVIVDDEALEGVLIPTLTELLRDQSRRQRMANAARRLFRPDGAKNIADALRQLTA